MGRHHASYVWQPMSGKIEEKIMKKERINRSRAIPYMFLGVMLFFDLMERGYGNGSYIWLLAGLLGGTAYRPQRRYLQMVAGASIAALVVVVDNYATTASMLDFSIMIVMAMAVATLVSVAWQSDKRIIIGRKREKPICPEYPQGPRWDA